MAPDGPEKVSIYRHRDQAGLSLGSSFTFRCHAGLPCFNRCCRTPTIILSPYDILRLKQCLGLTSGEFLKRYTRQEIEAWSGLPLVFLDPYRSEEPGCPFVGANGCLVYAHRPAACRLFPITMGSRLTDQGVVDYYFCRRLDYCRGFAAGVRWTLESWMINQGFAEYAQGRQEWLEILLHAGLRDPPADARLRDLFATIAYDLDRFRTLAGQPTFLEACGLTGEAAEVLDLGDQALLELSYACQKALMSTTGAGVREAARCSLGGVEERD